MKTKQFEIQFTEFIPEKLKNDVLYISIEYATASHKCACGCGNEVVTPFTPTDWKLIYDGETITISPSIGNWSYACRSHYIIKNSRVIWANEMSQETIEHGRKIDRARKKTYYKDDSKSSHEQINSQSRAITNKPIGIVGRILRLLGLKN